MTLLESRQTLGGRASSFQDADTGDIIDNCQHVTMGCCTELARFCSQNGLSEMLRKQRTLYFADEAGRISKLPIDPLPSPLHLTRAFARMGFLTYAERMRVAWGMLRLFSTRNYNRGSFLNWLQENRQNQRTIDRFWSVVLISALNETLDRIEFRYARQVIIEGFLANHKAPVIEIPDVPLGDLYGAKLKSTLEHRGVDFHINTSVAELQFASGQVAAIRCRSGENFTADHYVLAVPPQRVLDLISSDEIRARM